MPNKDYFLLPADRNPITSVLAFNGLALAPHAEISRALYTVPAQKKAILEHAFVSLLRITAAAPIGKYGAFCAIKGSANKMVQVVLLTNVIGDKDHEIITNKIDLIAGDTVDLRTFDLSTGGTVDYVVGAKLTEYDA